MMSEIMKFEAIFQKHLAAERAFIKVIKPQQIQGYLEGYGTHLDEAAQNRACEAATSEVNG
jgi:hypothetical protein